MGRAEVSDYMGVVCGRGFLRGCTNRVVDLGGGLTSAPRACGMRVRLDTRGGVEWQGLWLLAASALRTWGEMCHGYLI